MSVGDEDWDSIHDVEPWYNGGDRQPSPCPDDCEPCASCLERDERELRELRASQNRKGDCDTIEVGGDPCFSGGCGCYCQTEARLEASCPRAAE